MAYSGLIERYAACLPLPDAVEAVSLHEGDTPLIRLNNLPQVLDLEIEIHVKFEGMNPTGSFKDRGMSVAVTQALHEGRQALICASTGNTSASAAAYAARAGMRALVLIPDGKIAFGKLAQTLIKGARVIQLRGNFDQGMQLVKELAPELGLAIVNSINPYRLQGQKTAALEILETLGDAPDYHCLPVGNAGNITAYWMGYSEAVGRPGFCTETARAALPIYREAAKTVKRAPRMLGYQARGAAPLVLGKAVAAPETVATAIRIGNPQSWRQAEAAVAESGGWLRACADEEILEAQRLLARHEGIFCEPASAASIAGLIKDARAGRLAKGSVAVCTLTGHGLKDPDAVMLQLGDRGAVVVDAERGAVRAALAESL